MGTLIFALTLSGWLVGQHDIRFIDAETDDPLPFATVMTGSDTLSADADGALMAPTSISESEIITVSALGYETANFTLRDLATNAFTGKLTPSILSLESVTVAGRRAERIDRVTAAIEVISAARIQRAQSLTTTDALANLTGAYVQQSQFGGGSPILRGFEANRVLLVVDGVRLNNAIYRAGHLQNAITIDPLALQQMEVIYGAGSLAYGSDALGGVIHFKTREPKFRALPRDAGLKGEFMVSAATAARSLQVGGRFEYGGPKWASLTLLSTTQTSDLRAGAQRKNYPDFGRRNQYVSPRAAGDLIVENEDPNRQVGTAYDQYNLLQKFRFQLAPKLELGINLQASTSSNIPRYDALTERANGQLRWARWDYGPQTRLLGAVSLRDARPTRLYDEATYLLSQQFIEEDRIRRRLGDLFEENNLENVLVANFQVDFAKRLSEAYRISYGIDARFDRVNSEAFVREVFTGLQLEDVIPTRYPSGGSSLSAGGLYADVTRQLTDTWNLRGGVRLARQRLSSSFGATDLIEWPESYLDGIVNTNTAVTGALGLRHNGRRKAIRLLVAQGFRAPNVDDFGKFRERNGFILIPNPDVKPERSTTAEVGYEIFNEARTSRLGATTYYTWLTDAIVRGSARLPNGDDRFVSRGDTLRTQSNQNTSSARIFGLDVYGTYRFAESWELSADVHYLRGRRRQLAPDGATLDLPQDHIPPPYGKIGLAYREKRLTAGARLRFQLAKDPSEYAVSAISIGGDGAYFFDRTGSSDNLEFTPLDAVDNDFVGSRAWWTVNLFSEYKIGKSLVVTLKADNLLDRHYRTFSSGVSAAGVDVGGGLRWRF